MKGSGSNRFGAKGVGLVARYQIISGKTYMYAARVNKSGVNTVVTILGYFGGSPVSLATKNLGQVDGVLTFKLSNNLLTLSLNNSVALSVTNSQLQTPGAVGIATFGYPEQFDNYSVTH